MLHRKKLTFSKIYSFFNRKTAEALNHVFQIESLHGIHVEYVTIYDTGVRFQRDNFKF